MTLADGPARAYRAGGFRLIGITHSWLLDRPKRGLCARARPARVRNRIALPDQTAGRARSSSRCRWRPRDRVHRRSAVHRLRRYRTPTLPGDVGKSPGVGKVGCIACRWTSLRQRGGVASASPPSPFPRPPPLCTVTNPSRRPAAAARRMSAAPGAAGAPTVGRGRRGDQHERRAISRRTCARRDDSAGCRPRLQVGSAVGSPLVPRPPSVVSRQVRSGSGVGGVRRAAYPWNTARHS